MCLSELIFQQETSIVFTLSSAVYLNNPERKCTPQTGYLFKDCVDKLVRHRQITEESARLSFYTLFSPIYTMTSANNFNNIIVTVKRKLRGSVSSVTSHGTEGVSSIPAQQYNILLASSTPTGGIKLQSLSKVITLNGIKCKPAKTQ